MKKILITFALLLSLTLCLASCGGAKTVRLGFSDFSITLPEGYVLTEDKLSEDQVAYYYKDENSVDFDVYLWDKNGVYTLESEAKHFASVYGATAEPVTVSEFDGWKYVSIEDFDGLTYTVVNYLFEDDSYIIEISFWTDGSDKEYKVVSDILGTLKRN